MRIRSIKPEFWRSDDIAGLRRDVRLLFIGLWSYVDDNGVGIDDYRQIAADLLALEDDPLGARNFVRDSLATLSAAGLIARYEHGGKRYLFVLTWDRHQRVDKPGKPRYPRPDVSGVTMTDATTSENASVPGDVAESSGESREDVAPGAGEQRNRGTEENHSLSGSMAAASKAKKKATRIPEDFTVTSKMVEWAQRDCPDVDGRFQTQQFMDHWRADDSKKATKRDWVAAWRTWMRNAQNWSRPKSTAQSAGNVVALRDHSPDGPGTPAHFQRAMERARAKEAGLA